MKKNYLISERQYRKIIYEQNILSSLWGATKNAINPMIDNLKKKPIDLLKSIFSEQNEVFKILIPKMAKDKYPNDPIKEDGFRHILASAYFTTKVGSKLTLLGGYITEILGSIREMLNLRGFSSGWTMDTRNNDIGIAIGLKNKNSSLTELAKLIKPIVDNGEFYTNNGILYKNDKNPKK